MHDWICCWRWRIIDSASKMNTYPAVNSNSSVVLVCMYWNSKPHFKVLRVLISFCIFVVHLANQNNLPMVKLLLKVMSSVEELRQTQKQHTAMLQSVMKQLQAPSRSTETTMPAGIMFPLSSVEDIDKLDEHLQNEKTKETLVRIYKFLNGTFLGI